MVLGSPSASLANKLVFGAPEDALPADSNAPEGLGAGTENNIQHDSFELDVQ